MKYPEEASKSILTSGPVLRFIVFSFLQMGTSFVTSDLLPWVTKPLKWDQLLNKRISQIFPLGDNSH